MTMAAKKGLLGWVVLTGVLVAGCSEKKAEETPTPEPDPAAAAATEQDSPVAAEAEPAEGEPAEGETAQAEAPAEPDDAVGGEDQSELDCDAADVTCPLYDFQIANAQTAVENNDTDALAKVLHQIEFFAPDPSWNEGENGWAQIARRGAVAAEAGNMREARRACRECHRLFPDEEMPFRKMYETQGHRTRALPELPADAETTGLAG